MNNNVYRGLFVSRLEFGRRQQIGSCFLSNNHNQHYKYTHHRYTTPTPASCVVVAKGGCKPRTMSRAYVRVVSCPACSRARCRSHVKVERGRAIPLDLAHQMSYPPHPPPQALAARPLLQESLLSCHDELILSIVLVAHGDRSALQAVSLAARASTRLLFLPTISTTTILSPLAKRD